VVRYVYEVDGREYEGNSVYARDPALIKAKRFELVPEEVGESVPVYVNPHRPDQAALRKGVHYTMWIPLAVGFGLLSVGAIFFYAMRKYYLKNFKGGGDQGAIGSSGVLDGRTG